MRVVLTQNVENLGIIGDEKEVKNGYARNWLLPQKLVVGSNDPNAKKIIADVKKKREQVAKELDEARKMAENINGKIINLSVKAGEKGKLFGAITANDIAKELKIDKKYIEMPPIKSIGVHEINLKFNFNVKAKIRVDVKKQESLKKNK